MSAHATHPDNSWASGLKQGLLVGLAVLAVVLPPGRTPLRRLAPEQVPTLPAPVQRKLDFGAEVATPEVRQVAQWVVAQADNGVRPFVIIDKRDARVFVFEPTGTLRGATPVLLGYAQGDDSVVGIGQRPIAQVLPQERTTPAGRFVAAPGRNTVPEDVLWVDYEAAVSMHRVRATDPRERRLERLASPTSSDNRISYGCINVPVAFFEQVLWPLMGRGGIVYVLPETKPLEAVFPGAAHPPARA